MNGIVIQNNSDEQNIFIKENYIIVDIKCNLIKFCKPNSYDQFKNLHIQKIYIKIYKNHLTGFPEHWYYNIIDI